MGQVFAKMGNNKSAGGSWIKAELLKGYSHSGMLQTITRLFNFFRVKGLPKDWNELLLVSVHKNGSADNPNNFRGILLMPVLSNAFSQLILKRMEGMVDQ